MVHHTASPLRTDGQLDVNYIVSGSPVAPVSNLYLDRTGVAWCCAGGPTNTNGAGGPLGTVPKDQMNAHAIGIEIANNGIGEAYPVVQQDAAVVMVRALCAHYGISQIYSHSQWAPTRKIDPTGPSRWSPQGGKWNMDAFRAEVAATPPPPPPPTVQENNDMIRIDINPGTPQWVSLVIGATTITHTVNGHHAAVLERAGTAQENVNKTELLGILQSLRATNDSPFAPGWQSADADLHAAWVAAMARKS
jgi:hypothetical protein